MSYQKKGQPDGDVKRCEFSLYNVHLNRCTFFKVGLVLGGLFCFFSGPRSLQYKAECLGWSGSLLLQTEAALISDYGRQQRDYRYVLYMTPLQKTRTIALRPEKKIGTHILPFSDFEPLLLYNHNQVFHLQGKLCMFSHFVPFCIILLHLTSIHFISSCFTWIMFKLDLT